MDRVGISESSKQVGAKPARLTPEMVSRRLQVLGEVRRYLGQNRASPSLGEIAARVGCSRKAAKRAVDTLVREGLLLRRPGARGLALPSELGAAVRCLRAFGFASVAEAEAALLSGTGNKIGTADHSAQTA